MTSSSPLEVPAFRHYISICRSLPDLTISSKQSSPICQPTVSDILTRPFSSTLDEVNRKARKSYNLSGDPIKLPSKLLAIIPDPAHHGAVYVAESAATVKRVDLDTRKISHTYTGPTAPLTSLCISTDGTKLYAGCWDKLVWSWDIASGASTSKFQGHRDFVKSIICFRTPAGQDILVSGGAEGDVLIWNSETGQRLGVVKGGNHAIQDLRPDPLEEHLRLFAAFSDPGIRHFTVPSLEKNIRNLSFSSSISVHDTSVYKLYFDTDGDLWTASADKTARHLVRADNWKPDTILPHPDFVRDIIVHETHGWIITACRDEEVRVWSLATGDLHHTFSGHFEEVTGLCLVGNKIVSISIDATIRQWPLNPKDLQKAREEAANPETAAEDKKQKKKNTDSALTLTEEEERELDRLMESEEQEIQDLMAADKQ
jgi:WD40 repeat protein